MSNVKNKKSECYTPCLSVATDTIPEARSSQTGASVKYVPDSQKKWYVFRASYGRESKAYDILVENGVYAYVPQRYIYKDVNGSPKKVLQNLIPNLIFVYVSKEKVENYIKFESRLSFLSFYYNHFKSDENQNNLPLIISNKEMENFILATCNKSEHLRFVTESQCNYKRGDMVRVIEGAFKGVEGKVARISGQQRVVVSITGIGLVSTAYIPTAFLESVN